jgi:hypothetical protein
MVFGFDLRMQKMCSARLKVNNYALTTPETVKHASKSALKEKRGVVFLKEEHSIGVDIKFAVNAVVFIYTNKQPEKESLY